MPHRPTRSLKHEYELFVEGEIENYKESLPRSVLLGIGDEAAAHLAAASQTVLTEMLMCEEVDRIIFKRLRLPTYQTWKRRRLKLLAELRRPEHWGLQTEDVLSRAVQAGAERHVLLAGARDEGTALYLAAQGCEVTTLDAEEESLERILHAAAAAGLSARVHGQIGDLRSWTPLEPLSAVVCTLDALARLTRRERARVIELLQRATLDGGVHLVQRAAGDRAPLSLDELESRYDGWQVTVEEGADASNVFLARKLVS
jgi:hypothetical protein